MHYYYHYPPRQPPHPDHPRVSALARHEAEAHPGAEVPREAARPPVRLRQGEGLSRKGADGKWLKWRPKIINYGYLLITLLSHLTSSLPTRKVVSEELRDDELRGQEPGQEAAGPRHLETLRHRQPDVRDAHLERDGAHDLVQVRISA